MRFVRIILALAFGLISAVAVGQNGMLTVRVNVVGSTHLDVHAADQTASGPGTASFDVSLGALSDLQATPSGFTLSRDKNQSTLNSLLQTRALKANLPNTGYTLTAHLQRPLPAGVIWRLNGVMLSADNPTAVASGVFGLAGSLSLQIVVSDSAAAAPLDNAVLFTVILN